LQARIEYDEGDGYRHLDDKVNPESTHGPQSWQPDHVDDGYGAGDGYAKQRSGGARGVTAPGFHEVGANDDEDRSEDLGLIWIDWKGHGS